MGKTKKGTKKPTVIWLESSMSGEEEMFYCFRCRIPLIEIRGDVTRVVPGGSPVSPSTSLKCKGSFKNRYNEWEECGMYYTFMGTVFTENPTLE